MSRLRAIYSFEDFLDIGQFFILYLAITSVGLWSITLGLKYSLAVSLGFLVICGLGSLFRPRYKPGLIVIAPPRIMAVTGIAIVTAGIYGLIYQATFGAESIQWVFVTVFTFLGLLVLGFSISSKQIIIGDTVIFVRKEILNFKTERKYKLSEAYAVKYKYFPPMRIFFKSGDVLEIVFPGPNNIRDLPPAKEMKFSGYPFSNRLREELDRRTISSVLGKERFTEQDFDSARFNFMSWRLLLASIALGIVLASLGLRLR